MADVGSLFVSIGLNAENLEKGLTKTKKIVSNTVDEIGSMGNKMDSMFGSLAKGPLGLLATVLKNTLSAVTALGSYIVGTFITAVKAATVVVGALTAAMVALGAAAFSVASDFDKTFGKMAAKIGATKEQIKGELGQVVKDIFSANFGDSIEEVGDAVIYIQQNIDGLDGKNIQLLAEDAFKLRDAFGVDVSKSINAADALMEKFGLTNEQAMDFIAKGFQEGLDKSGDFLDTIGEYSNLMAESGMSAGQFFSTLKTGLQGGVLGTDKVIDLWKEFQIRINDGSDTTGTALSRLGIDYEGLQNQIASGSITVTDAFGMVQNKLASLGSSVSQNQVGVALFGTQFEDMGAKAFFAIDTAKTGMDQLAGASESLNVQYDTLGDMWEGLRRRALVSLTPIGDILIESFKKGMPFLESVVGWFTDTAVPKITEFVTKASQILEGWFGSLGEKLGPVFQRVKDAFTNAFGGMFEGVSIETFLQGFQSGLDLVVSGINILGKHIVDAVPRIQETFSWISNTAIPWIVQAFQTAAPKVQQFFSWFREVAIPWITEFSSRAGSVLMEFFRNFDTNFGPALERLQDAIGGVAESLGIASGKDGVSGMDAAIAILKSGLGAAVTLFDLWAKSVGFVADQIKYTIDLLKPLYNLVRDLINLLPKLVGSPIMALSGGKTFQQLAGFAEGGPVSGGVPIVVGERGPEIFMPGTSGQIIPNNQIGGSFTSLTVSNEYVTGLRTIESITNKIVEASQKLLETFDGLVASVKSLAGGLNSVKAPDVAAPSSFSSFSGNTAKRQTKSPAALAFEASQRAKIEASFDNFKEVNPKAIDRQKTREWYLRNLAAGVPRDELEKLLPPGFAQGGQFVVPPGFPNDSYMMGVTSGELVTVVPQNQVNRTMYNSLTIHSNAQTENLAADYNMMAAWESD